MISWLRIRFACAAVGRIVAFCAIVTGGASVAMAQGVRPSDVVTAELRPGWRTAEGVHIAALHLRLAEGWITYWRVPGEGGFAPRIDWSETANIAHVTKHWPLPRVFAFEGYSSIGYAGELVLPIEITPRNRDDAITLDALATIGVCLDVCMPVDLRLRGNLGSATTPDPVIQAALARAPLPATQVGLSAVRCAIEPKGGNRMRLRAAMDLPPLGADERMIIELPGSKLRVRQGESTRNGSTLEGIAEISARRDMPLSVERGQIRLTVLSDSGGVEHRGCSLSP